MSAKLNKYDVFDVLKAVLFSILISLIAVMIFTFIVKWTGIGDKAIAPVNIGIKIFSIGVGCLLGIRNGRYGMIKGAVIGLLFALLTYLVFSLVNRSFTVNPITVYDVLCGILAGLLSGIFAVNLRKGNIRE